jgi:hypothetical protein
VNTPGPTRADFGQRQPQGPKRWGHIIPHAPTHRTRSHSLNEGKEEEADNADDGTPGQGQNLPPEGGDDGGSSGGNDDRDEDSEMEDADEDPVEDPENVGTGKYYEPQTPNGKAMAKMFRRFCDLPAKDANAIVVYFGVYSVERLTAFQQDHWKDTFTKWKKWHPNRDGLEQVMILSPPQQDRIYCTAWACHHFVRLQWPQEFFEITRLRPQHFEPIRAQMECEEEGKVTIKMIPNLTDVPMWNDSGSTSMSKHFRVFEAYLSWDYGVEGFPLDWIVRSSLQPVYWSNVMTLNAQQRGLRPDFFQSKEMDHQCRIHAPIVPINDQHHLKCNDKKVITEWESGSKANHRSNVFHCNDAIVFHLARIVFADSPGEVHCIPKKGKVQQSGRQSYFACKGQFVGINTAHLECDLT